MALDDSAFAAKADSLLRSLAEKLEDALDADVEMQGGILTLTLDDGGQYVVNKHAATKQMWVSSPRSGAWHFAYDEGSGGWRSTRQPEQTLAALLRDELGLAD